MGQQHRHRRLVAVAIRADGRRVPMQLPDRRRGIPGRQARARSARAYWHPYRLPAGDWRTTEVGTPRKRPRTTIHQDPRRGARVFRFVRTHPATDHQHPTRHHPASSDHRQEGTRPMTTEQSRATSPGATEQGPRPTPQTRTHPRRPGAPPPWVATSRVRARKLPRRSSGPVRPCSPTPGPGTDAASARMSCARRSSARAWTSIFGYPGGVDPAAVRRAGTTIPRSATSWCATSRARPTLLTAMPVSRARSVCASARPALAPPTWSPASPPHSSTPSRWSPSPATCPARSSARTPSRRSTSRASRCP